jgi:hypothetical protein
MDTFGNVLLAPPQPIKIS